ncbi:hypothetical protein KQI63_12030 [bacterium]|nr:hypothetical protein [bacterium]
MKKFTLAIMIAGFFAVTANVQARPFYNASAKVKMPLEQPVDKGPFNERDQRFNEDPVFIGPFQIHHYWHNEDPVSKGPFNDRVAFPLEDPLDEGPQPPHPWLKLEKERRSTR